MATISILKKIIKGIINNVLLEVLELTMRNILLEVVNKSAITSLNFGLKFCLRYLYDIFKVCLWYINSKDHAQIQQQCY